MITPADYGINIDSLKDKMYNLKRKKVVCHINVIFYYGNQHEMVIERSKVTNAGEIAEFLKVDKPDKIRIEYFKGANDPKYDTFKIYPFAPVSETIPIPAQQQFQGLGEVEINNLVDQRFRKKQHDEEFEQLQVQVTELTKELDEQTEMVEELEAENEQLRTELESKKQIRYYAGMLGDILEGIGISKDKIRSPIAHLMGVTETAESTKEDETETQVEEPEIKPKSQQSKRREIITLIADYLESTDNQTLGKVFTVFSEIEHNPPLADDLINFIESKKEEL